MTQDIIILKDNSSKTVFEKLSEADENMLQTSLVSSPKLKTTLGALDSESFQSLLMKLIPLKKGTSLKSLLVSRGVSEAEFASIFQSKR